MARVSLYPVYHPLSNLLLGSATAEAAQKLLLQYFAEKNQPERRVFIAREQSYHGTTFGALSIGSYFSRRKPFEDVLMDVPRISACNPYRNKRAEETDQQYVARLEAELERMFLDVGPGKIAGFFCEPVVGAVSILEHSTQIDGFTGVHLFSSSLKGYTKPAGQA
jgi:adenosylmethionine-8-amino-7-oxononanoate aminotransferase